MPDSKYIYYIFNKSTYTKYPSLRHSISMQHTLMNYFKFQCGNRDNDR